MNHQNRGLLKRHRADKRFELLGYLASGVALLFVLVVVGGLLSWASRGFKRQECLCVVTFDQKAISQGIVDGVLTRNFDVEDLVKDDFGPDKKPSHLLHHILAPSAHKMLFDTLAQDPHLLNTTQEMWLPVEAFATRAHQKPALSQPLAQAMKSLAKQKRLRSVFRWDFFTHGDSRDPVFAGVWSGLVGTFYLFLVTLAISFPLGVAAAFYLEELSKPNLVSRFIEVNIANLAAVPSVVFGILGLSLFLNTAHMPRSSTLVGGLTLSLMTLPTLIIVTRSAIRAVPKNIRESARGLGASSMQIICHHLFPLALPGIVTGTLIAMARAIGETAPLLMVGMMAFVAEPAGSLTDPSTALPVQIYAWARNPETSFLADASAALIVLLAFVGIMNIIAIYLRGKYEHKW
ncbi:MAG: phosphate ABC transporter permease PstA [Proteobacteria bacterium]|nr:phosphate ABC transporter permease PstA [Pseudomonadota bacterium]